jgi:hypothetical protein
MAQGRGATIRQLVTGSVRAFVLRLLLGWLVRPAGGPFPGMGGAFAAPLLAPISYDELMQGSIDSDGEIDSYTFDANPGDRILFRGAISSPNLSLFFRILRDGDMVCGGFYTSNAGEGDCQLVSGGSYELRVNSFTASERGMYSVYVQNLTASPDVLPITYDQLLSGVITPTLDTDTFKLSGSVGDRVIIRAGRTSGNVQLSLRLFRDDDSSYPCFSNAALGDFVEVECTLTTSGPHTVLVGQWRESLSGDATGSYNVYVQSATMATDAVRIGYDQTISATITPTLDIDSYHFTGENGDRILTRVLRSDSRIQPQVDIYRPDGTLVCGTILMEQTCTLTGTLQYSILVRDWIDDETAGYHLHLQRLNAPGDPQMIGMGQTLTDSLDALLDTDAFVFSGTAGDTITLTLGLTSGEANPAFKVYQEDGSVLAGCEGASERRCTLATSGRHIILVADWQNGLLGSYRLTLDCASAACTPPPACYNWDGDTGVDVEDMLMVASRWESWANNSDPDGNPTTPNYLLRYDTDADGRISIADIARVAGDWGESCP